jgi:hypothetical protein
MRNALAAGVLCLAGSGPGSVAAAQVSAVQFYNPALDHYFMTSFGFEQDILDAGTIPGWLRTVGNFKVENAPGPGLVPVCRFFSDSFRPKSSHFYTPFANECALLKAGSVWSYEGDAFYVRLPDAAGHCPAGNTPIYRLYNDGRGGAPNHVYTPSPSAAASFRADGYVPEGIGPSGVTFCVPSFFNVAAQRMAAFANSTWEFSYVIAGVQQTIRAVVAAYVESGNPEIPYVAPVSSPPGEAGWSPYAGEIGVALVIGEDVHLLSADYTSGEFVFGCAFLPDVFGDPLTLGPCMPMTGRRLSRP